MIKLINGLLTPTEGTVLVDGQAPGTYTHSIISYLPDRPYLSDWMRVSDLLAFFPTFYKDFDQVKADEMLKDLKIGPGQRLKVLSKGTKEKVQLILTMSRKAQLYVLDEPIAGVDPAARDYILGTILSNYSEGGQCPALHPPDRRHRAGAGRGGLYPGGRHGPAQGRGRHPGGDGQVGGYSVPGRCSHAEQTDSIRVEGGRAGVYPHVWRPDPGGDADPLPAGEPGAVQLHAL